MRHVTTSYISRYVATSTIAVVAAPLASSCRYVHEQPFVDLPPDVYKSEAYNMARDALVQLNVMVRRGIEPDALMYTSLIATMGRAKLEWQAYKLFSRMLEQGVRPLPETYVALHDATATSRRRLRQDLQLKIEESLETFPSELAEAELARQREQDRLCVQKFEDYMRGVLPLPSPPLTEEKQQEEMKMSTNTSDGKETHNDSTTWEGLKNTPTAEIDMKEDQRVESITTMHIRNPTDAWSTARMVEKQWARDTHCAQGDTVTLLSEKLYHLHEEELRIFLAAQRQLRHGTKEELVRRVLETVGEKAIHDMLERRKYYFRSVAHILENDLRVLQQEKGNDDNHNDNNNHVPQGTHASFSFPDSTLTPAEKENVAPEVLHTPWGILRKPIKRQPGPPALHNAERLDRVRLSADELQLIRRKGETKDLDELPESLLRRYAYEFNLKWKRRHPLSLLEAVQWHCTTFLPEQLDGTVVVRPTPALRRQQEEEGIGKTLENYEAFRIISQRTNNLQVVDNKEINLHLKRIQREMLQKERRAEETMRREKNLLDAAALAASAKTFKPPVETPPTVSHVLGIHSVDDIENSNKDIVNKTECLSSAPSINMTENISKEENIGELPPWAIFSGGEEFNISTGRFGDPNMGRFQELSDGNFKLLPLREAQQKWVVDRQLLPGPLQDKLQQAELQQQLKHDAIEKQYEEKLQYKRYRKWDTFLRKAQEKRKAKKSTNDDDSDSDNIVRPLPPKRRLSQLLRKGRDMAPIEESVKAKYNRTL